jgi:hypothetical protein
MALALPGTAMSVNMDIGVANDWHFPNKPEAGHRLALPARAKVYGETALVYSGPFYVSKSIEPPSSSGGAHAIPSRDTGALQASGPFRQ